MVGEIRDSETAGIAVNAAMSGHLVLSTLHANDAATTIPRILDMDIEPFLIASTAKVIIAQRLVRKICSKCLASYQLSQEEIDIIKKHPLLPQMLEARGHKDSKKLTMFRGEGCKVCNNSGYSGRVGIFEVMEVNEEIRQAIVKHASSDEITDIAQKTGMKIMLEDGLDKALQGGTTLSEIIRVTESFN
jgi:type IV pilus assembly protein PilB